MNQQNPPSKTFCMHPFTGLATREDGAVKICCRSAPIGFIQENTLEEIWNGPEYKKFRQMHIDGSFPENHKCKKSCDQIKVFEYIKK